MEHVLAGIDASAYADTVCDLASWASRRLTMPVELLHVVQRKNAVAARHDLSGAIGLGVKSDLLEELTRLEETDSRLQIESGRVLLPLPRIDFARLAWPKFAFCTATAGLWKRSWAMRSAPGSS